MKIKIINNNLYELIVNEVLRFLAKKENKTLYIVGGSYERYRSYFEFYIKNNILFYDIEKIEFIDDETIDKKLYLLNVVNDIFEIKYKHSFIEVELDKSKTKVLVNKDLIRLYESEDYFLTIDHMKIKYKTIDQKNYIINKVKEKILEILNIENEFIFKIVNANEMELEGIKQDLLNLK